MKIPHYKKFLEARLINDVAARYPEPMREPFIWFANYVRERCHSNVDLVADQTKKMGFPTTEGTFSKILIGRWNTDSKNRPLKNPITNLENFLQIIDRLRSHDRAASLMGKVPFIKTSAWDKIEAYIEVRRAKDAICKFGIILGPTGAQKGACAKHYCRENNHGACSYFEAPYKPSLREFRMTLGSAFGCHVRHTDRERNARIKEGINETRTLYIANIQRLYIPGRGWYQDVFNWLQETQEVTDCTVILEGVLEFQNDLRLGQEQGYFEQFEGRCGGDFLILPPFPPASDLYAIGEAFGLERDAKTLKLLDKIVHERGRIRRLFHILQKAKRVANVEGADMTLDHVREVYEDMPINAPIPDEDEPIIDGEMPTRGLLPAINNRQSTIRNPQSAI